MIDVGFIAVQAARGTFSHFNTQSDPITLIGQTIFQYGVMALFLADLVLVVVLGLQRVGDVALDRAIRVGLLLAGSGLAAFRVVAVAQRGDLESVPKVSSCN